MRLWGAYILVLLAVLSTAACSSPNSILLDTRPGLVYGTVRDTETLNPLPGASVRFADDRRTIKNPDGLGTFTDINGFYELRVLPKESLVLRVSYVGYATKQMNFYLPRSDTLRVDWVLVQGEPLEEIIVCGSCDA